MRMGDARAEDQLLQIVYNELRRMARNAMRSERPDHTLQPTALVHEAFIRLTGGAPIDWVDRGHFFSVASRTMRRVLINHARQVHSKKRWGGQRVDIDERLLINGSKASALIALEEALERLETTEPRQCQIVELRFFGGLNVEETAAILKVSPKTVQRDWKMARAWLHGEVSDARLD